MAKLKLPVEASHLQSDIDAVDLHLSSTPEPTLLVAAPGQVLTAEQKAFNFCLIWAKVGPVVGAVLKFLSIFSWFTGAWVTALQSLIAVADASCAPAPPVPPPTT